jgi:hypothetical protein
VPQNYPWWIFAIGQSLGLAAWITWARRVTARSTLMLATETPRARERAG